MANPALTADGKRGPLSGADWERYQIGDLIGEGGMATVYQAWDQQHDRLIAIKTLPGFLSGDERARHRFASEARTANTINSPHVVAVHDAGTYRGMLYFAMEFMPSSLKDRLATLRAKRQQMPVIEALNYLRQAALGLQSAAARGIIHRDIKPANLMLDADGILKISDFGIAKVIGDETLTATGTTLGTPAYMSPEQGRGESVDSRSDLYALGCVCYEMLCGSPPYTASGADALIYQHNFADPTALTTVRDDVSEGVQAMIFTLLQKQASKRYQHHSDLIDDIDRLREGRPTVVAPADGLRDCGGHDALVAHGPPQKRPWVLGMASLLFLATAILVGGWWFDRDGAIERLRSRLQPLDQAVPIPAGANDLLAQLAGVVGEQDPDLRRWSDKVAQVQAIHEQLSGLEQPLADDWQTLPEKLDTLEQLVGPDDPLLRIWRERHAAMRRERERITTDLRALDGLQLVPISLRDRFRADLKTLATMLPDDHPDRRRWTAAVARSDDREATCRAGLAALADRALLTAGEASIAGPLVDDLGFLVDADDAQLRQWQQRLAKRQERILTLRKRLAALDQLDTLSGMEALADELAQFGTLVGSDDPDHRRWSARLTEARAEAAVIATTLDGLTDNSGPAQQQAAEEALHKARRLLADDERLDRWAARVDRLEQAIVLRQRNLADLLAQEQHDRNDLALIRETVAILGRSERLDDQLAAEAERALAQAATEITRLRQALAHLDRPTAIDKRSATWLAALQQLVGDDDADLQRWQTKLDRYQRCLLAIADRDPKARQAALATLAELVGTEAPVYRQAQDQDQQLSRLLGTLHQLDAAGADSQTAAATLDALADSPLNTDPTIQAIRARFDQRLALRRRIAAIEASWHPLDEEQAAADLTALRAAFGPTASDVRRYEQRQAELRGPPRPAWAEADGIDRYGRWASLRLADQELVFRWIPPGRSMIGSPVDASHRDDDEGPLRYTTTTGFWLAATECTQATAERLLGRRPACYTRGDDHPVDSLTLAEAQAIIAALNEHSGAPGRLPSECEWEYACRVGSRGPLHPGEHGQPVEASRIAHFASATGSRPVAVGMPNPIGLYDMLGNCWEWCADTYAPYRDQQATDRLITGSGDQVIRGASWGDDETRLRAANRHHVDPALRSAYIGLRIAIDATDAP